MRGTEIVFNCPVTEVLQVGDRKLLNIPEEERVFEVWYGRGIAVQRRDLAEFDLGGRRLVFEPTMRVEENEGFISVLNQDGEYVVIFPKEAVVSVGQISDTNC